MEERKKIRGSATAEGKEDGQGKAGEETARFTKGQFLEFKDFPVLPPVQQKGHRYDPPVGKGCICGCCRNKIDIRSRKFLVLCDKRHFIAGCGGMI